MSAIVLNVNDEFVANPFCVRAIPNDLCFDDQGVSGQKKVHSCAGTCITRRELLGANVTDPGTQQRVQKVLNVVLAAEGQGLKALPTMCQRMHCSAEAANDDFKE